MSRRLRRILQVHGGHVPDVVAFAAAEFSTHARRMPAFSICLRASGSLLAAE